MLRRETYTASVTGNRALVLAVLASLALMAGYALRALTETNGSAESPPLASASATVTASAPATVPPVVTSTATASLQTGNAIVINVARLLEDKPDYSIDVEYPQLGLALDGKIKSVVDSASDDIRNLARDHPPVSSGPAAKYSLDGHFDSVFVASDLVSLRALHIHLYGWCPSQFDHLWLQLQSPDIQGINARRRPGPHRHDNRRSFGPDCGPA